MAKSALNQHPVNAYTPGQQYPPHSGNYNQPPPYGAYNQFNTFNSYGPNYYNPNLPPVYGAPHYQNYPQQPIYSTPPPSHPQSNPYANYQQNTSQISLGGATFGSERTSLAIEKEKTPETKGGVFMW